ARAQREGLVVRDVDDERLAAGAERPEHRRGGLGLLLGHGVQRVDDHERAVGDLRRQRRAQRAQLHLARQRVLVAARLRAAHGAALAPQRIADLADAGAARTLLPPRLLAGAADERAVLRRMGAAALRRVLLDDGFPDEIRLDAPAEHLVVEVQAADGFLVCVYYIDLHGLLLSVLAGPHPRSLSLGAALRAVRSAASLGPQALPTANGQLSTSSQSSSRPSPCRPSRPAAPARASRPPPCGPRCRCPERPAPRRG